VAGTTAKGNYYRNRTKQWLQSLGWEVESLERSQRIVIQDEKAPGGLRVIFKKHDIWGADLIAKNGEAVLFVQSKSRDDHVAKGMKEISVGGWPDSPCVKRWVTVWPPRRRLVDGPDVHEVEAPRDDSIEF
jgi:hypothetical protein